MSIYEKITSQIVQAIETGAAGEWRMPWHHNGSPTTRPLNVDRGAPYRGVNTLILWVAAEQAAYETGYWGTYRQWAARGAQVRKGERGTGVVFWRQVEDENETDENGDPKKRLIARGYTVFNAAQVDGWEPPSVHVLSGSLRDEAADRFAANTGVEVQHRGDRAFYAPGFDRVVVPTFEQFRSPDGYYSTIFHELGHATGHKSRVGRDLTGRFDSEAYAMEELVAVIPDWQDVCPEDMRIDGDSPCHSDWMLAADPPVNMIGWYHTEWDPETAAFKDAAEAHALEMLRALVPEQRIDGQVLASGRPAAGTAWHPDSGTDMPDDAILVVPDLSVRWHDAAMECLRRGAGVVIGERGGAMAHLVTVGRESGLTILRMPGARDACPSGARLDIEMADAGFRVEVLPAPENEIGTPAPGL